MRCRSLSSSLWISNILAYVWCSTQVSPFCFPAGRRTARVPHFLNNTRSRKVSSTVCSGWCQWAEILPGENAATDKIIFHEITNNPGWESPRAWLQATKSDENGVYTVLRCDYRFADGVWKVWGLSFHLQRLQHSYSRSHDLHFGDLGSQHSSDVEYQVASQRSQRILDKLLQNIATNLLEKVKTSGRLDFTPSSLWMATVMITLCWQIRPGGGHDGIAVMGHCFSSGNPVNLWEHHPDAAVTSIALASEQHNISINTPSLPNRFTYHPEAKLTSWIDRRRPLEQAFQTSGIGEVLLLRQVSDDSDTEDIKYELLEGLTSNVFFVYPGGLLRTTPSGVLLGYGRHMVLEVATNCEGLKVDNTSKTPITLDDCHIWQEVFLTSSVKLVVPVSQILYQAPADNDVEAIVWRQLWSTPTDRVDNELPIWRKIRDHLIRNVHGYDMPIQT